MRFCRVHMYSVAADVDDRAFIARMAVEFGEVWRRLRQIYNDRCEAWKARGSLHRHKPTISAWDLLHAA